MAFASPGSTSFIRRDAFGNFHMGPSTFVIERNENKVLRDLGVVISKPKFPKYSTVYQRIVSFEKWPDPATRVMIGSFSESGLFYTGTDDIAQCFYCGLRLNNWSVETCVWKAHACWRPQCDYVLLCKGQTFIKDFINSVKNNNNNAKAANGEKKEDIFASDSTATNNIEILDEKCPSWRSDGIVQNASEIGFDLNLIATAIISNDFEMFDILDQMLEEMEKLDKTQSKRNGSPLPNDATFAEVSVAKPIPEDRLCKICMINESSIVLLPCSHLICCPLCSPALDQCPLCRSPLSGRLRIYSA